MYIRNMTSARTGKQVSNQFIVEHNGKTYFQSYESLIAVVRYNSLAGVYECAIGSDWDYSKTTMKYLYRFLEECFNVCVDWNKQEILLAINRGEIQYCQFESELETF